MSNFELLKTIAPWLTGGLVGALVTALVTERRGRIQPVSMKVTVSFLDIPSIMHGYESQITLSRHVEDGTTVQRHHFQRLSTIEIELVNIGNKDFPEFDFGINLLSSASIIGVQHKSGDRYHSVEYKPTIKINDPSSQLDCILKPFNRKDRYNITLVVGFADSNLSEHISLSKSLPVRFVDPRTTYKTALQIALALMTESPLGWPISTVAGLTSKYKRS